MNISCLISALDREGDAELVRRVACAAYRKAVGPAERDYQWNEVERCERSLKVGCV